MIKRFYLFKISVANIHTQEMTFANRHLLNTFSQDSRNWRAVASAVRRGDAATCAGYASDCRGRGIWRKAPLRRSRPARLGRAKSAETGETATLILRDLRATAVTAIRMGGEAAPVLSVTRDGPDMLITLECARGQLTPEAALELISGFAGQLSEPLRHLL